MRSVKAIATAVICLLVLGVAACASPVSGGAPSAKWVTITGRNVSLSLPDSFKGGDVADPAVTAVLRTMAESRSMPEERQSLVEWLDDLERLAAAGSGPYLMALCAPSDGGHALTARIYAESLQNFSALTGGDSSMRALVDAFMVGLDQQYWKVDRMTAQQASIIVRYGAAGEGAPAEFHVIRVIGDSCFVTSYTCPEESWDAWYGVFKKSAETFKLVP